MFDDQIPEGNSWAAWWQIMAWPTLVIAVLIVAAGVLAIWDFREVKRLRVLRARDAAVDAARAARGIVPLDRRSSRVREVERITGAIEIVPTQLAIAPPVQTRSDTRS